MEMFFIGMVGSILVSCVFASVVATVITKVAEWLK